MAAGFTIALVAAIILGNRITRLEAIASGAHELSKFIMLAGLFILLAGYRTAHAGKRRRVAIWRTLSSPESASYSPSLSNARLIYDAELARPAERPRPALPLWLTRYPELALTRVAAASLLSGIVAIWILVGEFLVAPILALVGILMLAVCVLLTMLVVWLPSSVWRSAILAALLPLWAGVFWIGLIVVLNFWGGGRGIVWHLMNLLFGIGIVRVAYIVGIIALMFGFAGALVHRRYMATDANP